MSKTPVTIEAKKHFLEDLKSLVKDEYAEVFRILKRNDVELSENSNGIFFDLNCIQDDIFEKLAKFMELCKQQRNDDANRTKEIDSLRQESDALAAAHGK